MDKTDIVLCQLLLIDSRQPYRELANKLSLSINAVHKRVQQLTESGIIRTFTTQLNLSVLKALQVTVFGRSEAYSMDEILEKAANNDSIYWTAVAGGNFVYVGAYLRDISELDALISYVRKEIKIAEPKVGIQPPIRSRSSFTIGDLFPLDYEIIHALQRNSRKQISEVAEELHVSAKTVHRRLSRMIRENVIDFSLEWYPDVSNDIMTIFHLQLRASEDREAACRHMMKEYSPNLFFFFTFSNLPQFLLGFVWASSMKELQAIRKGLQGEEILASLVPNILYTGQIFQTWRDKLVSERATHMGGKAR